MSVKRGRGRILTKLSYQTHARQKPVNKCGHVEALLSCFERCVYKRYNYTLRSITGDWNSSDLSDRKFSDLRFLRLLKIEENWERQLIVWNPGYLNFRNRRHAFGLEWPLKPTSDLKYIMPSAKTCFFTAVLIMAYGK